MGRVSAPSMPTERQVKEAHAVATSLCPGARIKNIGPEGVTFDYPDNAQTASEWDHRPFSGEGT